MNDPLTPRQATLQTALRAALEQGLILSSTAENIQSSLPAASSLLEESLEELVRLEAWAELNDRFYKRLAFGTGGIRGRTIGQVITAAERGTPSSLGAPEHAAIGTNMMNAANIVRAAQGLGEYVLQTFPGKQSRIVIAYDTRHFSREFAQLCASALNAQGIDVSLFAEDRSTPQLSFTVRSLGAQAGIVISASHNPAHDNGFKAYFEDGAQLVEPHASGVIAQVNALAAGHPPTVPARPGQLTLLDTAADAPYVAAVATLVLEPEIFARANLRVVYTSIHGTGIRIIPTLFNHLGLAFSIVEEQRSPDGRFPTVKSPNPEEAAALSLAITQAQKEGADLVIGTDPDCDRMGAAVRDANGHYEIITGNMIGSILAYYRTERLFAQGKLNDGNKAKAVLIKTFVTTDLQKTIAAHFGVKCVETLTGFKYIGEKLRYYEGTGDFFIFGGEESYGYSGGNYVRDKDGNGAAVMLAEAAAWAKAQGQTLLDYLNGIYERFGYYVEKLGSLTFTGAAGAAQIQKLLASYRGHRPETFMNQTVVRVQDFSVDTAYDVDGHEIPKETMLMFHLADGSRMAVRASGTEPKIKFYFFTQALISGNLSEVKKHRQAFLEEWWTEVQADVQRRTS
jgi:phosphoglucomutase